MAVSVFHPEVVDGWRDDQPPVSTPGVVLRTTTEVTALQRATNLVPGLRAVPRIAPYYTDPAGQPAYLSSLVVSSAGQMTVAIEDRSRNAVNLTAAALRDLALVIRIGANQLLLPLADVQSQDSTAPYVWISAAITTWAGTLSVGNPALVEVALVDSTAGNVDGAEVLDPDPRFVPFVAVSEPVSFFSEAALANDIQGLVWAHTRRNLVGDAPPVPIVDTTIASLERALNPVNAEYVSVGEAAYVTRLDIAATELRLTVQSTPTSQRTRASAVELDLTNLVLAVQAPGTGLVTWQQELGGFEPEEGDVPGVYVFRAVAPPLSFRAALPRGAVTAVLVNANSPNVDLANYQFRRLVSPEDAYNLSQSSLRDGVRTRMSLVVFDTSGELSLSHLSVGQVSMRASLTVTPWTGELPRGLPTRVEVRETPTTGAYRQRRWIDHTADFESLSWAREVGSIASADASITTRNTPTAVFTGGEPEFIGRAIAQRFLDNGDLALTFPRTEAAADMRPGDSALIDGITTSPAATNAEFTVMTRESRGAQRYSVFDGGDIGPASLSGIIVQTSATAIGGSIEIGDVPILNITISSIVLTPTSIVIRYAGDIQDALDVVDRYAVFARAGGESWGVSLVESTPTSGLISATIEESERGNLLTITQQGVYPLSVAIVERVNADGVPNPRLSIGRREITLLDGDSLLTAVSPAPRDSVSFAGLIARLEFEVQSVVPATTTTARRINLMDRSLRFEVATDRYIRGIGIVGTGATAFMRYSVQTWAGANVDLDDDTLEKVILVFRHNDINYRMGLGTRSSLGRYHATASQEGSIQLTAFAAALSAGDTVLTAVIDRSFYALSADSLTLASNDGDFFELSFQPGLVPRSRSVRYSVGLPEPRLPFSVWDSQAASDTRGQYLGEDPVGDTTLESVAGVLMIQNDSTGFTDRGPGTAYFHRLLISHSAQTTGDNAGQHRIVLQIGTVAGATPPTPTTAATDQDIDGLILAFRVRRGTTEAEFFYSVQSGSDVRDAAGERTIIDHFNAGGFDFTTAPDSFDLAVVTPEDFDSADFTIPSTEVFFPRVAFGGTRFIAPWVVRDGAEFRVVLTLWPEQRSAATQVTDTRMRLSLAGIVLPLSPSDKLTVTEGAILLDGADPRDTPLQIVEYTAGSHLVVEHPGGIAVTAEVASWTRGIDRQPVMGGWFTNPEATLLKGGTKQEHSMTCVDYSSVLDRRLHGGGELVSQEGEGVGEFMGRLFQQWRVDIANSDEEITDAINRELGGVLEPAFSTEESGGTRSSWRSVLDTLQERAQGTAGYHMDANKRLVWREHGIYHGLSLDADDDYTELSIAEDRDRASNEVDVRAEPESTILVSEADRLFIEDRARVEGGTGRYQVVSDSGEGNAAGESIARQHAQDQLARYPFQRKATVTVIESPEMGYLQVVSLFLALPGDVMRISGPHLPAVPNVRTTNIAGNFLYVEPAATTEALPATVVAGALLQIDGVVLKVVGEGGPRGSVWCEVPAGVTMTPRLNTPARLLEQWLIQSVSIEAIPSGNVEWRQWVLTGTRPRIGSGVGRAQSGYVGQLRDLIRGAAG